MVMYLTEILGDGAAEAAVLVHGFVQQYQLFSAFSGADASSDSIKFLNEMANVFAMMGMLILLCSLSLWKAKY